MSWMQIKLKIQRCQIFAGQRHQTYTVAVNNGKGGHTVSGNGNGAWIQMDAILDFFELGQVGVSLDNDICALGNYQGILMPVMHENGFIKGLKAQFMGKSFTESFHVTIAVNIEQFKIQAGNSRPDLVRGKIRLIVAAIPGIKQIPCNGNGITGTG